MAENKGCDTCKHKVDESKDDEGNRIVKCEINKHQLYAPLVEECKHHSRIQPWRE